MANGEAAGIPATGSEAPMRLGDERESGNVEDRRGAGFGVSPGIAGGGLGAIAIVVVGLFLGVDPSVLLELVAGGGPAPTQQSGAYRDPRGPGSGEDAQKRFVAQVLAETEDTWREIF